VNAAHIVPIVLLLALAGLLYKLFGKTPRSSPNDYIVPKRLMTSAELKLFSVIKAAVPGYRVFG